jgi:single-stranded-DNA-specific exonuclease
LQVESFINADERLQGDPFWLPDMHLAVSRIYKALLSGEKIAVYGDFDADGITATALLVQGLTKLGGEVIPYIPNRLTEGYGLNITALQSLHRQGVGLVITVDCGITAMTQVIKAQKIGLDIIITDHHTPPTLIPPAIAIINPKCTGSTYSFPDLSGVGVALKLLQALFQGMGREKHLETLVDLVALGTIADMVPLLGENRYLVKRGLELINSTPRLGIREMINRSGLHIGGITPENISWVIAPQLNAAGRLAHAISSYKLLMTDSVQEAQELTLWLEQKNTERQQLTTKALAKAKAQVLAEGITPLIVIANEEYPVGIVGLIASRLSDEFYRPAIVIKIGDQVSSGSCRSIPEFNIIFALEACSHLLTRFGGHSRAAGFVLPTKNMDHFKQSLSQLATTQLAEVDLRPCLDIEAEVTLPELGGDTFQTIQKLAPFGQGNPIPTFLSRSVEVFNCRTMGGNGEHLKLNLRQGGTVWEGVGFGLGSNQVEVSLPLDVVYNLEVDRWVGRESLRLNILDFSPSR